MEESSRLYKFLVVPKGVYAEGTVLWVQGLFTTVTLSLLVDIKFTETSQVSNNRLIQDSL